MSIIVALQTQSSDLSRELSSVSTSAFGVKAFYERFASLAVCDVLILRLFGVNTCIQNMKKFLHPQHIILSHSVIKSTV